MNLLRTPSRPTGVRCAVAVLLLSMSGLGLAQTINFSQTPLYLAASVKPNLLVLYDNSPSMEYLLTTGRGTTSLADANTRGNIARSVLRQNITTYQNTFRWGLSTFAMNAPIFLTSAASLDLPTLYYSTGGNGSGAMLEDVQDNSTTHYQRLMTLMANETSTLSTTELKNGSVGTPLPGAIRTAYQYFSNTLSGHPSPIIDKTCQRNFVVIATDGDPTIRTDGTAYTTAETTNSVLNGTWTFGQAARDVFTQISALRSVAVTNNSAINGQYDVQTYLIGLGDVASDASSIAAMNRMAQLGGTTSTYLASDQAAVNTAFAKITNDIAARTSAGSAVALNSGSLTTGSEAYQGRFSSADWSGQLLAYPLDSTGMPQTTPRWDASVQLNAQNWTTGRKIFTYKASAALGARGIPFRWPANAASPGATELDLSMVTALNRNGSGITDAYGSQRLNYLRGDTSRELRLCTGCTAPLFRSRPTSVLGDIVNSAPAYVKGGDQYVRDAVEAAAYATYRQARAAMTPLVAVGANDGMLHVFNSSTGNEVFAYVPSLVASQLSALTETTFTHQYNVDGSPMARDVYYGSAWHTVLVSSLGAGGKGLFALDLTDPTKFAESTASSVVRWEISGSDGDVGHLLQQPLITRMKNGRWMAIVGNGYNSTNGRAVLLLVDVETGAITRISTLAGSTSSVNGLSGVVAVSSANNGVADTVYAGDLAGSIWKFDLSSTDSTQWKVAYGSTSSPKELFATATGQPITARIDVTAHPQGGYLVTFGTGRYLDTGDNAAGSVQALYGIWDNGGTVNANKLTTQSVLGTGTGPDGRSYRFTTHAVGPATPAYTGDNTITRADFLSTKLGWVLNLPTSGERIVTQAAVRAGKVVVSTMIPSTVACTYGGDGWVMEVDAVTGNRPDTPSLDTNADGNVDAADMLTYQAGKTNPSGVKAGAIPSAPRFIRAQNRTLDDKLITLSTGTIMKVRESGVSQGSGRSGWEQIQ
ncbi:PilC/PilY family type IV pilus protein [Sphaerotilus sp.]|uniref:pilus assembly protein n=1 Tax=Sphaerotilus sp. TaxID=2093942 RepID=UPI00286E713F|nr:PilC/PilY family type IV pilus protein [Sphaerotilus sp.]